MTTFLHKKIYLAVVAGAPLLACSAIQPPPITKPRLADRAAAQRQVEATVGDLGIEQVMGSADEITLDDLTRNFTHSINIWNTLATRSLSETKQETAQ